jgi:hypothetical protein
LLVAGLKNAAAAASASIASIATDAGNGACVSFPAILASAATPAPDNTKSSASLYEFSVLLIALLSLFV